MLIHLVSEDWNLITGGFCHDSIFWAHVRVEDDVASEAESAVSGADSVVAAWDGTYCARWADASVEDGRRSRDDSVAACDR